MRRGLLATTLLSSLCWAGAAAAQEPAGVGGQLEEIVVTATRQADTVNRVPLSVSAQTQRSMDQIGIRNVADLQGRVPALTITQAGPGVSNIAIRGISNTASSPTAATTGFYLDDIPLQKRNTQGFGNSPSNGTPLPPLFDLDRVEVLRGPQGTLFGGSSQGGTIRYITPQPSLNRFSVYARGEGSSIKDGGEIWEGGVAVGGPIVQDKLGFRVSYFQRDAGGWIDFMDPYTQQVRHKDANSGDTRLFRGSLAWAPTEDTRITFAYFSSSDEVRTTQTQTTLPITNAITERPACYNTAVASSATYPTPVACNSPQATYQRPGAVYGPYPNLGADDFLAWVDLQPSKTMLTIPSLTAEYNGPTFSVKSITSYIYDRSRARAFGPLELTNRTGRFEMDGLPANPATPGYFVRGLPLSTQFPDAGIETGPYSAFSTGRNDRYGMTQEIRFSSPGDARPFSWVAGVFYSNFRTHTRQTTLHGEDDISQRFYGLSIVQRYGQNLATVPGSGQQLLWDDINQYLRDTELAVFGEGNYWITDKLRATVGLRWSRVDFDYRMTLFGASNRLGDPVTGAAATGAPPQPSLANGGIVTGSTTDDPITPKFGLQYQLSDRNMVYATASKGFRAGGVNGNQSPGICLPALALQGIDFNALSRTFDSDTVWSYEGGAKLRVLDNRVQLNGAVYRIDWSNMQFSTSISGCPFVSNIGSARSQGGELEVNAAVFRGFTANLAVGYTDAKYTADTYTPGRTPQLVAADGQPFPLAKWTVNIGARYDHTISTGVRGYVRADWRWASSYDQNFFGVVGYNPDIQDVPAVSRMNLRLGLEYGDFDINLFANNLFNQKDGPLTGGRSGCTAAGGPDCTNYNSYNPVYGVTRGMPRQIGVQIAYRR